MTADETGCGCVSDPADWAGVAAPYELVGLYSKKYVVGMSSSSASSCTIVTTGREAARGPGSSDPRPVTTSTTTGPRR